MRQSLMVGNCLLVALSQCTVNFGAFWIWDLGVRDAQPVETQICFLDVIIVSNDFNFHIHIYKYQNI